MRRPLRIIEQGNTIVVKGNAKLLLQAGGFRGVYVGTVRGWILDRDREADLCAYLDSRRVAYVLTSDRGVPHGEQRGVLHQGDGDQQHDLLDDQLHGLFEDGAA